MKNLINLIGIVFLLLSIILYSCKKEEIPTLSTSTITNITSNSASSGGVITSDGGAEVTARGVCWGSNANPTTSDTKTNDGNGSGQFVSSITGINAGSTYHVRAFATNSVGTAYGADLEFSTLGDPPLCLSQAATNISSTGATLNGTVNANDLSTTVTFEYGTTTSYGQTINSTQSPVTGNSITNVNADVTGLAAGTTFHFRIKTVNTLGTKYGDDMLFTTQNAIFNPDLTYGSVSDIDGNTYKTIQIGTQVWMAENLKTTKYNDGISIPKITDNFEWGDLDPYSNSPYYGAFCWYNNDSATYENDYGKLYNNAAVETGKLCPSGWKVPDNSEWTILTDYLKDNGYGYLGNELAIAKSMAVTSGWTISSTAGTIGNDQLSNNKSGFSALPGGGRSPNGTFSGIGDNTTWWLADRWFHDAIPWYFNLLYNSSFVYRYYAEPSSGFSVRCLFGVLPVLSTTYVTYITETTATTGGFISSDKDSFVTSRGVCWSTTESPTILDNITIDGSGTGSFTSNLTGLTVYTTYYVRAYATNGAGTAYGNEINFTTIPESDLAIGKSFQGGIIAYILQPGDPGYIVGQTHGIIAAPSDQGNAEWGCYGLSIPGGIEIGSGYQNTKEIVAGCAEQGIAAKLCDDLELGGYSDWYLPSKDELNKLQLNRTIIGGFIDEYYWSSSEAGNKYAWYYDFHFNWEDFDGKYMPYAVRAIRSF